MATIDEARKALDKFKGFLRLEALPKGAISDVSDPVTLDDIWVKQDYFPGCDNGSENAGVYFLFDVNGEIIYVGKASNNNAIGHRLGTYFETDPSDKTTWQLSVSANHKFGKHPSPAAISVIVISDFEFAWIAPALEEYLIKKLHPVVNTVGKRKSENG